MRCQRACAVGCREFAVGRLQFAVTEVGLGGLGVLGGCPVGNRARREVGTGQSMRVAARHVAERVTVHVTDIVIAQVTVAVTVVATAQVTAQVS